jgi:elongation factor G
MATPEKDTRNIAILAHVDAGKTTVSERLLYFSEAIPGLGEVDEGLATMDYLEEEKKRGITIEAGIASYSWKGSRVTFVDTPGHVDFGVEVDFALRAVEGVILVLSGVSGIESQSLEAWEKIKANRNRTLVFINKLDLASADYRRVIEQVQVLFGVKPLALTLPVYVKPKEGGAPILDGVIDVLNQLALFRSVEHPRKLIKGEVPAFLAEEYAAARKHLIDVASAYNDAVMDAYLKGEEIRNEDVIAGLKAAMSDGHVPVYMGSAIKNVGIRQLMNGVNQLLPAPFTPFAPEMPAALAGSLGFVIKIRHYQDIGKIFLAKVFDPAGLRKLDSARAFRVFAESLEEIHDPAEVKPGDIVALQTARPWRMGEILLPEGRHDGSGSGPAALVPGATGTGLRPYKPLLQSRIELVKAEDFAHVDAILKQLDETEPSIDIEPDPSTGGWLISTVGELQLDVFTKRLKKDHKCDIKIGAPTVRYLEKPKFKSLDFENSLATGGFEVKMAITASPHPGEDRNLLTFSDPAISAEYREVLESAFDQFCTQGTCGYGSTAGLSVNVAKIEGNRHPIPLPFLAKTFADALKLNLICAQFEVFEPIMKLEIITPDEFCGMVLADLAARGGIVRKLDSDGYNSIILLEIPLANTFGYTTLLRSLSKGLGVYVLTYEKHGVRRNS